MIFTSYATVLYYSRWRGDFGDKKQFWFPEHLVEELDLPEETEDTAPLGALQKGCIDIQGSRVGKFCF